MEAGTALTKSAEKLFGGIVVVVKVDADFGESCLNERAKKVEMILAVLFDGIEEIPAQSFTKEFGNTIREDGELFCPETNPAAAFLRVTGVVHGLKVVTKTEDNPGILGNGPGAFAERCYQPAVKGFVHDRLLLCDWPSPADNRDSASKR